MSQDATLDDGSKLLQEIVRGIVNQAPDGWENIILNVAANDEDSLDFMSSAKVADKRLSFGIKSDAVLNIVKLRKSMSSDNPDRKWENMELTIDKTGKFDVNYKYKE